MMSLLVALAIVAAATCQGSNSILMSRNSAKGRIHNGDDALRGEFPFMARVYVVLYGTTYQCGGALIAKRVVVTAAHCLVGSVRDATVVLGDHTDSADPQETYFSVASWIIHPDYDDGGIGKVSANDIGLIYLGSDADLTNPYITTISLPTSNDEWMYEEGESVTVIGWGGTERYTLAETLQKLTYNFVSEETCREYWEESIKDGMVCTGSIPADASHSWGGDSGGPLFSTGHGRDSWTLLALVSWGVVDDFVHTWDVNTDVLYFVDWIRAYTYSYSDLPWQDVKPHRDARTRLPFNMEKFPLQIQKNDRDGTIRVDLWSEDMNTFVTTMMVYFTSSAEVETEFCRKKRNGLTISPPLPGPDVWTFTKHGQTFRLQCNGALVQEFNDAGCSTTPAKRIEFHFNDDSSDKFM